ncbi:hypothetical protein Q8791_23405 [Nocardiopsis sp. CT-R113]|uniref:Uncharacterized protein n=1 Tax=Nocardiopsis codii TaxID=3065942 RepID=A0ABU7KD53_9ACTN|nr:hypothetical protein [Nocardiopsis sp. CT-R113]MEE2040168.1 hypothetical protein [Nocardiopsis sp. CT-R113]
MCDPETPPEPDYDVTVSGPYRYEMTMTDQYEGWLELTVSDTMSPTNARYSPETLDAAVRAFCQVVHAESPVRVVKRANAHATRPGVFFPPA